MSGVSALRHAKQRKAASQRRGISLERRRRQLASRIPVSTTTAPPPHLTAASGAGEDAIGDMLQRLQGCCCAAAPTEHDAERGLRVVAELHTHFNADSRHIQTHAAQPLLQAGVHALELFVQQNAARLHAAHWSMVFGVAANVLRLLCQFKGAAAPVCPHLQQTAIACMARKDAADTWQPALALWANMLAIMKSAAEAWDLLTQPSNAGLPQALHSMFQTDCAAAAPTQHADDLLPLLVIMADVMPSTDTSVAARQLRVVVQTVATTLLAATPQTPHTVRACIMLDKLTARTGVASPTKESPSIAAFCSLVQETPAAAIALLHLAMSPDKEARLAALRVISRAFEVSQFLDDVNAFLRKNGAWQAVLTAMRQGDRADVHEAAPILYNAIIDEPELARDVTPAVLFQLLTVAADHRQYTEQARSTVLLTVLHLQTEGYVAWSAFGGRQIGRRETLGSLLVSAMLSHISGSQRDYHCMQAVVDALQYILDREDEAVAGMASEVKTETGFEEALTRAHAMYHDVPSIEAPIEEILRILDGVSEYEEAMDTHTFTADTVAQNILSADHFPPGVAAQVMQMQFGQ